VTGPLFYLIHLGSVVHLGHFFQLRLMHNLYSTVFLAGSSGSSREEVAAGLDGRGSVCSDHTVPYVLSFVTGAGGR
jgi:hypothetical protein